jgi:hypothetical protein
MCVVAGGPARPKACDGPFKQCIAATVCEPQGSHCETPVSHLSNTIIQWPKLVGWFVGDKQQLPKLCTSQRTIAYWTRSPPAVLLVHCLQPIQASSRRSFSSNTMKVPDIAQYEKPVLVNAVKLSQRKQLLTDKGGWKEWLQVLLNAQTPQEMITHLSCRVPSMALLPGSTFGSSSSSAGSMLDMPVHLTSGSATFVPSSLSASSPPYHCLVYQYINAYVPCLAAVCGPKRRTVRPEAPHCAAASRVPGSPQQPSARPQGSSQGAGEASEAAKTAAAMAAEVQAGE